MSRKWRYRIGACILPLALLAGCGDGTETGGAPSESVGSPVEPVDVSGLVDETPEPISTPEPEPEPEIGLRYQTGQLTAQEETAVLEAMTTLHQNLEIAEYLGEGIHMISGEGWLEDMCRGGGREVRGGVRDMAVRWRERQHPAGAGNLRRRNHRRGIQEIRIHGRTRGGLRHVDEPGELRL